MLSCAPSPTPDQQKDDDVKSTDTALRYGGYSGAMVVRFAGKFLKSFRYAAYTSDVGEAFRPVVSQNAVRACYGLSWIYVTTDVAYETHKAHERGVTGAPLCRVATERSVFQALASMGIPAFLIHSQVNIFTKVFKRYGKYQRWGPTIAGLSIVPFLPFMLDEPCEHAIGWAFDRVWPFPDDHPRRHSNDDEEAGDEAKKEKAH